MIRVLVVDDEILVRVGVRSLLPWEEYGLQIVGEASGGEEAIARLAELHPDVVLTDLAMRRGDGFSLIRAVKRERPGAAVVVLSCHNEFENVQEALRLGADDYVFKLTLDPSEMIEVFTRISRRRGWPPPGPRRAAEGPSASTPPAVSRLPDREEVGGSGLEPLAPGERLLVFVTDAEARLQAPLESLVREVLRSRHTAGRPVRCRGYAALLIAAEDGELEAIVAEVRELVSRYVSARVRAGATRAAGRQIAGEDAAREVELALGQTFYEPDRLGLAPASLGAPPDGLGSLLRGELERLKGALLMLDVPLLLATWGEAIGIAERARDPDIRRVRGALLDLLSPLHEEALRRGLDTALVMPLDGRPLHDHLLSAGTLAEIHDAVAAAITRFASALKSGRTAPRSAIRAAVRYVESNLNRPVTVVEAAAAAGMSVSHFAHTFRHEMECSFVVFVNRVKMDRARELLLTTELRVHEVAEAVGFETASYFSTLFRKVIGCSPADIRAKRKS